MVVSRVFICSGVWFWLISVIVVVSHLCAGVRLGGCLFFDFYFVYVLMNGAAICRELCSDVWFCCFVWILMICVRQVSVNDMWELFLAFFTSS